MFSIDELEALVLGSRLVARRAEDQRLADAAANALSKITAVLPADLRDSVDASTMLVGRAEQVPATVDLAIVRHAIRLERRLRIGYSDADGIVTERIVWPFAIGFFERVRIIVAWCELRDDFRTFRLDRISELHMLDDRYPRRRAVLLKEWREREGVPPP
jgi:predicted DNA-binding transcriptional regulator YafY